MNAIRLLAASFLGLTMVSSAWAGGMSIGVPSITGISPGLSQQCVQKLGVKAQGAQAARAAHDCRKPVGPDASSNEAPAVAATPTKPQ